MILRRQVQNVPGEGGGPSRKNAFVLLRLIAYFVFRFRVPHSVVGKSLLAVAILARASFKVP